jgi:hypothetical protein
MHTPERARRSVAFFFSALPATSTLPAVSGIWPEIALSSVV